MKRVAIVGVGLVGGSLAMALKRARPSLELVGVDRPEVLDRARSRLILDQAEADPERAIAEADLVVLATPVGAILDFLVRFGHRFHPGALVTDVGSTKRRIAEAAESLPKSVRFIGGHPMAGKAESGFEAASADLFQKAPWALVPRRRTPLEAIGQLSDLVRAVGGVPVLTEAESHDRAVAVVSHLPQLVAVVLCQQAASVERALDLAGPAFGDLARLASSPFALWKDILATNKDLVRAALVELLERLGDLPAALEEDRLEPLFAAARDAAMSDSRRDAGREKTTGGRRDQ